MSGAQLSFSCSACGRQFAWKPELAGKRAKCKCGQALQAPLEPPEPEVPLELESEAAPAASACPSCGAELAAGAVLCIDCGYNTETGAIMGTELPDLPAESPIAPPVLPPRPAKQAYVAPVPMPRRQPTSNQTQDSGSLKMVVLAGVLVALLIGGIIGAKTYLKGSRAPSKPMLGKDATAVQMLKDDSPVEAKAYLNMHESYMLGVKWTRKQAEYKVDEWYRMGAKKVWAFTGIISRHVVFELPPEPEKRAQLFGWVERWDEEHMRTPQKDVGQDYLIVDLM